VIAAKVRRGGGGGVGGGGAGISGASGAAEQVSIKKIKLAARGPREEN
jgi:hypothetical protein